MKIMDNSISIDKAPHGARISFFTQDFSEVDKVNDIRTKRGLEAKIAPQKAKRSLTANAYMWTLCDKIAKEIHTTKEDVYRLAIRDVGVYREIVIQSNAIDDFQKEWIGDSVGRLVREIDKRMSGDIIYSTLWCYKGSSEYDTKEMARLIDYIVDEAKNLNIETLPPNELERLTQQWGVVQ